MKKTIWIINQDASTPETGYAGRSYYLSEELSKLGHQVYLIAGGFSHLHFKSPILSKNIEIRKESLLNFVWIKLPSYKNAHSKKRILNWFLFAFRISKLLEVIPENKPDIIIYSSPPIIGYLGALSLRRKTNAKLVFELRDIWPLTLQQIGGLNWFNPLIFLMAKIERIAYHRSDFFISNLSNAFEYLKKFKISNEQYLWVPNGVSLKEIEKEIPLCPIIDSKIPKGKFVIGYSGTLGAANAVEFLLKASIELRENNRFVFVIVGTGKESEMLKLMVKGNDNVIFIDPVPKEQIYSLLSRFDVCYLGWRKHKLYQYGIGSNKLPEYLFSKKPIIHSYSGERDLVSLAKAGLSIEAESHKKIIDAIYILANKTQAERDVFGRNGFEFATKYLRYDLLAKKIQNELL